MPKKIRIAKPRKLGKTKPVIPEPSLNFIAWSAIVAAMILSGIVIFDIVNGQAGLTANATNAVHSQ